MIVSNDVINDDKISGRNRNATDCVAEPLTQSDGMLSRYSDAREVHDAPSDIVCWRPLAPEPVDRFAGSSRAPCVRAWYLSRVPLLHHQHLLRLCGCRSHLSLPRSSRQQLQSSQHRHRGLSVSAPMEASPP